jgi:hypothetical protein
MGRTRRNRGGKTKSRRGNKKSALRKTIRDVALAAAAFAAAAYIKRKRSRKLIKH